MLISFRNVVKNHLELSIIQSNLRKIQPDPIHDPMSPWSDFPSDYRSQEVSAIRAAVKAGECVAVIGLSGAGKSNLVGFLAQRTGGLEGAPPMTLVDCNRLGAVSVEGLSSLTRKSLGDFTPATDEYGALEKLIRGKIQEHGSLCLLFDRFDLVMEARSSDPEAPHNPIFSHLRALRDAHKYALTYVIATRRPLGADNELAELFFAHTLWLGPLSESDARWNLERYAGRLGLNWDVEVFEAILEVSGCYPSLIKAACEAISGGVEPNFESLASHPTMQRRVEEFWASQPSEEALRQSGLSEHPLLSATRPALAFDTSQLTAKEHLLWQYLSGHAGQVCEKDDLIQAVWPEDQVYEQGIRDDSLAQLVRRLREKAESDPSNPRHIQTVPGRGYKFIEDS
jgi:energy-coupling factor transporter ATP-binding protein EcfA2